MLRTTDDDGQVVSRVRRTVLPSGLRIITEDMPGVAGLPLLAAFLTAAANGGSSLSPWYFVIAAAMWLVLVARQGRERVQRWSTTVASVRTPVVQNDVETQVMWGYGNVARQLGLAAVVSGGRVVGAGRVQRHLRRHRNGQQCTRNHN